MAEPVTRTGGCHCGLVRFECTTDFSFVTDCNCSICTKHGLHLAFVPETSFMLRSGDDDLRDYYFHKKVIRHRFCSNCGTHVFAQAKSGDRPMIAININCIDGIDLDSIQMTKVDGRSF